MNYTKYYKKSAVYKITINHKIYVGSTINLYDRYKLHESHLLNNKHYNIYLQRTYNKYKTFDFEILELYENIKRKDLLKEELRYINLLNPIFNVIRDPVLNTISDEGRLKISNSVKKAYKEGRLINPWTLNGNYIDVYDYYGNVLEQNILVKDFVINYKISNRSVINNAIRFKRYIIKDYIIVPHKLDLKIVLKESTNEKYKIFIS